MVTAPQCCEVRDLYTVASLVRDLLGGGDLGQLSSHQHRGTGGPLQLKFLSVCDKGVSGSAPGMAHLKDTGQCCVLGQQSGSLPSITSSNPSLHTLNSALLHFLICHQGYTPSLKRAL